jgi:hypothetical protein
VIYIQTNLRIKINFPYFGTTILSFLHKPKIYSIIYHKIPWMPITYVLDILIFQNITFLKLAKLIPFLFRFVTIEINFNTMNYLRSPHEKFTKTWELTLRLMRYEQETAKSKLDQVGVDIPTYIRTDKRNSWLFLVNHAGWCCTESK